MPTPAVSATMMSGVGVPGFCTNWKNVLADAGTAATSANIPKIDNLFAILNASTPNRTRSSPEKIHEFTVNLSEKLLTNPYRIVPQLQGVSTLRGARGVPARC